MDILKDVELLLSNHNLTIISKDIEKPWGGFYVLDESQAQSFASLFFNNLDVSKLSLSGKLSPKILVIKPKKRLSWQYHYRRSEIWSVIKGSIKVIKSDDDTEKNKINMNILEAAWKTNLEVRPGEDWKDLKGRAVS